MSQPRESGIRVDYVVEAVPYGSLALRGSQDWNDRAVRDALSEAPLTAAAMQRFHLDAALKRELAQRLGPLREAA